jgi:periplasmic protein TonB
MTAFALHLPEQRSSGRWLLAAAVIVGVHAAIAVALLWHPRNPPEPELVPAIAVSLAPVQSAAPEVHEQDDPPAGPEMQQADAPPPDPPKQEQQKVEQQVPPPPPIANADAVLPKEEPKPIEKPKEEVQPPAPETRAPPKNEHVGQFTQAASNAYNALIVGHLDKYKRYPAAGHNAVGKTTLRFTLDRDGKVIDVEIAKSSGNNVLDQEALAIVHRADPFPRFPAAKSQAQDLWTWTMNFDRETKR